MTYSVRLPASHRMVWLPLLMLVLAWSLAGCASPGSTGNDPLSAPLTEFDEPEQRKRARIRMELAAGYFEQGRTDIALDEIKQALAADATFVPAYVLRGLVFMQMNNPRLAEESFQRALQLNGRDPDALHNYGWFLCQQGRHAASVDLFNRALASPVYGGQARTYMAKGVCQLRMGQVSEAEGSLARSYELDPGNPIAAYNLAQLLFRRSQDERAQFIIRRLNNSEFANAETLWLGIKIERRLGNSEVVEQLATQLGRRFAESEQWRLYQRGAFHE